MDIRRAVPEGGDDHLINQFDHFARRLVKRILNLVFLLFLKADKRNHVQFFEHIFIGRFRLIFEEMQNKPLNILPDTHGKLNSTGFQQPGHLIYFPEIFWIIDKDF